MPSSSVSPESAGPPLRVVVADDHVLLRQGLVSLLESQGFDVVAQAGDARMPPTHTDDGLRAAVSIREAHADVGVLVLSQYIEPDYALALIGGEANDANLRRYLHGIPGVDAVGLEQRAAGLGTRSIKTTSKA